MTVKAPFGAHSGRSFPPQRQCMRSETYEWSAVIDAAYLHFICTFIIEGDGLDHFHPSSKELSQITLEDSGILGPWLDGDVWIIWNCCPPLLKERAVNVIRGDETSALPSELSIPLSWWTWENFVVVCMPSGSMNFHFITSVSPFWATILSGDLASVFISFLWRSFILALPRSSSFSI